MNTNNNNVTYENIPEEKVRSNNSKKRAKRRKKDLSRVEKYQHRFSILLPPNVRIITRKVDRRVAPKVC